MSDNDGKSKPPLLAILICERVLLEEDKVATLIRVVDTFNVSIELEGATEEELERVAVPIQCVVFTRWGLGKGEFTEEMRVAPLGREELLSSSVVKFKKPGGFHFHQVRHKVTFVVNKSGVYTFRVYLDNEFVGEHPFTVNIEKRSLPREGAVER